MSIRNKRDQFLRADLMWPLSVVFNHKQRFLCLLIICAGAEGGKPGHAEAAGEPKLRFWSAGYC